MTKRVYKSDFIGIIMLIIWIIIILLLLSGVRTENLPDISSIFSCMITDLRSADYWLNILFTLKRVYVGLGIALIVSIPLAIITSQIKILERCVLTIIEILRPIPNVAWVPISIMLFKKMDESVFFITFIGAFFPIFTNAYFGMTEIPTELERMTKGLNIRKADYIFEILWPHSLPCVFTGIHLGMGGAWLAVIMAEMISGNNGIGYLVWKNHTLINYPGVVSGMMVIGGFGALSSLIIKLLHHRVVFWEKY